MRKFAPAVRRSPRLVVLDLRRFVVFRHKEQLVYPCLHCDPDAVARDGACEKERGKEGKRRKDGGKKKMKKDLPSVAMRSKDKGGRQISVRKE